MTDPAEPNVFVAAVQWIEAVLLGSLATAIAVVAIASVGMLMLSGRLNLRRGASVIIGCFILFGAATIARGIQSLATVATAQEPQVVPPPPPNYPVYPARPSSDPSPLADDPYAGAAVRR